MSETLYTITIPDTSATLYYSPYVTNNASSGGWQSACPTYVADPNGQNSWMCDPDSAHISSSSQASMQVSFDGVGVDIVGNATNGIGYNITLDGQPVPGNPNPDLGLLYSVKGLKQGAHAVAITVQQPASSGSPGSVTFKQAVVSAGTGYTGATIIKRVLDDGDPSIMYYAPPGGNWTVEPAWVMSEGPNGGSSSGFHVSYWTDATATIKFQAGIGISVYGACYSHSRYAAYSTSLDDEPETLYDGTINLYSPDGNVKQRAGNCLRYFKTGLDQSKNHTLVLRVKDNGRLAVDWVEIVSVMGGQSIKDTGSSGGPSRIAIIAGAVGGGIALALVILGILIYLRRRRGRSPDLHAPQTQGQATQNQNQLVSTAFTPPPPSTSPTTQMSEIQPYSPPMTPPWIAPHTHTHSYPHPPNPSHSPPIDPTNYRPMGMGTVPGARMSVASSRVPLMSPGLSSASSYSGSAGGNPGWHDTSTYRSSSYSGSPAPIIGASISRPTTGATRTSSVGFGGMSIVGDGASVTAASVSGVGSGVNLSPGSGFETRAGSSTMAVEGIPSTNGSSYRAGLHDIPAAGVGGRASAAPPSYREVEEHDS
ncbi:hypothetical protein CTheo_8100 [Ceratobasidium theobromae]|uniref:Adenovirus e3 region domain containing protein n=1 Tax=Ceratobasidium theobromae TaxID=1582974 RepID=A0A5N5QA05_9AGAM|nr:hypothetical protein CTheo_8100 [Ceratobasidium theobromae]